MAVITPVGSNFDWSPKSEKLTKTASTGAQAPTDKDLLYEAAKKAVKAQMMDLGNDLPSNDMGGSSAPCEGAPCDSVEAPGSIPGEVVKDVSEVSSDGPSDIIPKDPASETFGDEKAEGAAVQDVQKAVKELVDKANKAEEIAAKVQDAVANMEEAVNAVKDAVGGGEIADEVEIEIEDDDNSEVEIEIEDDDSGGGNPFGKSDKGEDEKDEEGEKDEIVKESKDKDDKPEMKSSASGSDDMVKLSSLSKSVKQKVYDYWKNDLKYAPDYCKLLVTDN